MWIRGLALLAAATCMFVGREGVASPAAGGEADTAKPARAVPTAGQVAQPTCATPRALKVLFVGNSYMTMHDLPSLVEAFGQQAGIEIDAELLAMGGTNFEYHLHRERTRRAMQEGHYDAVVLQSHSLDVLRNRDGFFDAGAELVELVRQGGAEPILFETWARKVDHNLYNYFDPAGDGPADMQRAVHQGYEELGHQVGARVAEVGQAWRGLRKTAPGLNLHASDGNHPGRLGSYLSAAVVFATLTDLDPVPRLGPLLGIDRDAARLARQQAARVVQPSCESPAPRDVAGAASPDHEGPISPPGRPYRAGARFTGTPADP